MGSKGILLTEISLTEKNTVWFYWHVDDKQIRQNKASKQTNPINLNSEKKMGGFQSGRGFEVKWKTGHCLVLYIN